MSRIILKINRRWKRSLKAMIISVRLNEDLTKLLIVEMKEKDTESIGAGDLWDVESEGDES